MCDGVPPSQTEDIVSDDCFFWGVGLSVELSDNEKGKKKNSITPLTDFVTFFCCVLKFQNASVLVRQLS